MAKDAAGKPFHFSPQFVPEREDMFLVHERTWSAGMKTECRCWINSVQDELVVVWWEFENGKWTQDNGALVPNIPRLAEFLVEAL